ncbi:polysaccharide biosynthesis protein [Desulforamulus reducens MI-1]|uniref:Polysaccharide biosynthesis protein n=1 Tax=Desulforamulus reducens (strain ATCC BAA-1160 / DSM 100696 / MI-1) TaxID=349161 RepID=A4J8Z0_DESRM|nr:flippase [Desulforamulus reducens]ABO51543.1 polysaccharide biosynthesis protein [Desulforamulus reducens MI-1]
MSSIKRNVIYNISYQILALIVPLTTAPYISRVLGADGIGIYSYTFSIAHYFVLFTMLGVLNYGNRSISRVRDDDKLRSSTFWSIYIFQLLTGLVILILYGIYVGFFYEGNKLVALIQYIYVISGVIDISWFYFGIEKFKLTTLISGITKVVNLLAILLLIKRADQVWLYAGIVSGGLLINAVIYWILLPKYIHWERISWRQICMHIKPNLMLFIPVIAVSIYKYMDKIMLGAMANMTEVGYFENAEKLINIPSAIITAVGIVMLPRIANIVANGQNDNVKKYNYETMFFVMFLSVAMTFGLAGIADEFIPVFYGSEFSSSVSVIMYLLPSILFISWANVIRTQYLLPNSKDKNYCLSVLFGAVVNAIINTLLIPRLGAIGAAIGTTIAEGTVCIIQTIIAWKYMQIKKYLINGLPFIAIGIIMYIGIHKIYINNSLITTVARIVVGIIIYFILSYAYVWLYHRNEFEILRK